MPLLRSSSLKGASPSSFPVSPSQSQEHENRLRRRMSVGEVRQNIARKSFEQESDPRTHRAMVNPNERSSSFKSFRSRFRGGTVKDLQKGRASPEYSETDSEAANEDRPEAMQTIAEGVQGSAVSVADDPEETTQHNTDSEAVESLAPQTKQLDHEGREKLPFQGGKPREESNEQSPEAYRAPGSLSLAGSSLRLLSSRRVSLAAAPPVERSHNDRAKKAKKPQPSHSDARLQFGPNVVIFSPQQSMHEVQKHLDEIWDKTGKAQFTHDRFAIFFKPGKYNGLNIQVGYYITIHGLGRCPESTVIEGSINCLNSSVYGNALVNFWRGVENLTIIPSSKTMVWATSQGTYLRRVHVRGSLHLSDGDGFASGGFIADSVIDDGVSNGTQQQYFLRNTKMQSYNGGSYAQVFIGCEGQPQEQWPQKPYTVVKRTPVIREKPWLSLNGKGEYLVNTGSLHYKAHGPSWGDSCSSNKIHARDLSTFYVAHAEKDDADSLNRALRAGKSILFCPGVYKLNAALQVVHPETILLGIGMATLRPMQTHTILSTDDLPGVHIAGLLLDAGPNGTGTLCLIGDSKSSTSHAQDPTVLSDVFARVAGPAPGMAHSMMTINVRDTILDNVWLWRADHGNNAEQEIGWTKNPCKHGLVVHSDDVYAYGLFVEHNQEYQVLWMGERGCVLGFQSETPYDPPRQSSWSHSGVSGWASYKLASTVKSHYAAGLGIYCVMKTPHVVLDSAVEQPVTKGAKGFMESHFSNSTASPPSAGGSDGVVIRHAAIAWFESAEGTQISHIINKKGGPVSKFKREAQINSVYSA